MHPRSVESSVSLFFHCLPFFCTEELLYCQAVFSANGYRIRHCSGVAALEDVAAQQSLSSGSAKRAHGSQFIPGGVNQQFLGLLRVCVGVVEENQSIFGQDSITHLPSVLGAVAFVIFLKFTPFCYADGGCSLCSAESLSMLIGSYACEESWLSDKQLQS